jgi:hypothetical protein
MKAPNSRYSVTHVNRVSATTSTEKFENMHPVKGEKGVKE